jgi:hypothetical protein
MMAVVTAHTASLAQRCSGMQLQVSLLVTSYSHPCVGFVSAPHIPRNKDWRVTAQCCAECICKATLEDCGQGT